MPTLNAGILGATGAVGQKFIKLLQNHPWFNVKALGASERSANKRYKEAAHWIEDIEIPEPASELNVSTCEPAKFSEVDFVFSGLDSSVAGKVEQNFANAGIPVISNAKNFRMDENVPLLIPEINPGHIELIQRQSFHSSGQGWIVTNPNCVTVPLAMSLKPLYDAFGLEAVTVTSMQSVSGGGYPGVSSMDILANVVPFIGGEEDKIENETGKIFGSVDNRTIRRQTFPIQATATRVPTIAGHLLSVSVKLSNPPKSIKQAREAFYGWKSPIGKLNLPSSPSKSIRLYEKENYPQPRLHASREQGMQASVGRLRRDNVLDLAYVTMVHNTIRGAAGGAVLNAELLVEKNYL